MPDRRGKEVRMLTIFQSGASLTAPRDSPGGQEGDREGCDCWPSSSQRLGLLAVAPRQKTTPLAPLYPERLRLPPSLYPAFTALPSLSLNSLLVFGRGPAGVSDVLGFSFSSTVQRAVSKPDPLPSSAPPTLVEQERVPFLG